MEFLQRGPLRQFKFKSIYLAQSLEFFLQPPLYSLENIKSIGFNKAMDDYEKRKLRIFNQLNFLQLLAGILIPLFGLLHNGGTLPVKVWAIACLPAFTSIVILYLNHTRKYEPALFAYFILYPF
jgi:hypothetical protein